MIEKIVKYLLLSLIGISALTFAAIMVVDDDMIVDTAGPVAEPLIGIKHGVGSTVGEKSETFVYWLRTTVNDLTNFSPSNRVPRVVMRIPPPAPAKGVAAPVTETPMEDAQGQVADSPSPAPEPAPVAAEQIPATSQAPESMPMAADQPSQSVMAMPAQEPEPIPKQEPEPMPETSPAMMTDPPPSVMGTAPEPAPAPDTAPVQEVTSTPTEMPSNDASATTEQAALPDAAAPPPPPAPEREKPGESEYQMGLRFYNGDGVERNFGVAAQHFLTAAEAGHPGAQYNLGIMNYTGQTGGQDFANAAKWFERAANNGHAQAQYNLGFLYYEGKGVAQDIRIAFDWINRAAEQGYVKAVKARDALRQAIPELTGS